MHENKWNFSSFLTCGEQHVNIYIYIEVELLANKFSFLYLYYKLLSSWGFIRHWELFLPLSKSPFWFLDGAKLSMEMSLLSNTCLFVCFLPNILACSKYVYTGVSLQNHVSNPLWNTKVDTTGSTHLVMLHCMGLQPHQFSV